MNDRRAFAAADIIGASLAALTIGAAFLASRNGGDAWPVVALLLAAIGMVVAGRVVGWFHRAVLPAAVAITAIVLALTSTVIDGGPLSGPFGYRNATGAFYVQAVIAALMFAAAVRRWPLRIVGIAVAIPFAVIAAKDSSAAAVSLLALAIVAIAFAGDLLARVSVVAVATLFVLVLTATFVLGAGYDKGTQSVFTRALTERRLMLWNESLRIIQKDPSGVGPGRFQEVAPLAQKDQDARWAHNEFLQQGVELGRAGMALVVLLFLWGFARLWLHPEPGLVVALGAASLAALGIHASVDYVLHFPAIPLTAVALVATAQSVQRRRPRRDHEDPRTESLEGDAHPVWVAGTPSLW